MFQSNKSSKCTLCKRTSINLLHFTLFINTKTLATEIAYLPDKNKLNVSNNRTRSQSNVECVTVLVIEITK